MNITLTQAQFEELAIKARMFDRFASIVKASENSADPLTFIAHDAHKYFLNLSAVLKGLANG